MKISRTTMAGIALALGLTFPAAAQEAPEWLGGPVTKPLNEVTLGYSFYGTGGNTYLQQYLDYFRTYAAEYGVQVLILDAEANAAAQLQQIPDLITRRVDVALVHPVDKLAIVPALRQLHEAGIPVVTTASQADESASAYVASHTGPNDYEQAKLAAELLVEAIGGEGNVVIIQGTPGLASAEDRVRAFNDYIAAFPQVKVLDTRPGDWSQERSQAVMENFITRFGDTIDGVFTSDGYSGTGALTAVRAAVSEGRLPAGKVKFSDPSLVGTAYDAIKAGDYTGGVLQTPWSEARLAFETAIKVSQGIAVPPVIVVDTPVVTVDNVDTFERPSF